MEHQSMGQGPGTGSEGPPVPVRLRPLTPTAHSAWLPGTLRLSPGSLMWVPDPGVSGMPVELAAAVVIPVRGWRRIPGRDQVIELDTPAGRVQLEMLAKLFQLTQELVAETAGRQAPDDPATTD